MKPISHTVQPGECLSSIAYEYGFAEQTIWEHPDNQELKELRRNPYTLMPGDVVTVPVKRIKKVPAATNRRHVFRRKDVPARIEMQLRNDSDPMPGEPYVIELDGKEIEGETDSDGWIRETVCPNGQAGTIFFPRLQQRAIVKLRMLGPADEMTGIKGRLSNLAYYSGDIDAEDGPELEDGVRRFQRDHGLKETGKLDDATIAKIEEVSIN